VSIVLAVFVAVCVCGAVYVVLIAVVLTERTVCLKKCDSVTPRRLVPQKSDD
jgi:hypothetical protein